jgi:hypothetical protein
MKLLAAALVLAVSCNAVAAASFPQRADKIATKNAEAHSSEMKAVQVKAMNAALIQCVGYCGSTCLSHQG